MKYQIEVTQDDINNGKPHTCSSCPVALAISRTTNYKAEVGLYIITLFNSKGFSYRSIKIPADIRQFIKAFDSYMPVSPFSFELDI